MNAFITNENHHKKKEQCCLWCGTFLITPSVLLSDSSVQDSNEISNTTPTINHNSHNDKYSQSIRNGKNKDLCMCTWTHALVLTTCRNNINGDCHGINTNKKLLIIDCWKNNLENDQFKSFCTSSWTNLLNTRLDLGLLFHKFKFSYQDIQDFYENEYLRMINMSLTTVKKASISSNLIRFWISKWYETHGMVDESINSLENIILSARKSFGYHVANMHMCYLKIKHSLTKLRAVKDIQHESRDINKCIALCYLEWYTFQKCIKILIHESSFSLFSPTKEQNSLFMAAFTYLAQLLFLFCSTSNHSIIRSFASKIETFLFTDDCLSVLIGHIFPVNAQVHSTIDLIQILSQIIQNTTTTTVQSYFLCYSLHQLTQSCIIQFESGPLDLSSLTRIYFSLHPLSKDEFLSRKLTGLHQPDRDVSFFSASIPFIVFNPDFVQNHQNILLDILSVYCNNINEIVGQIQNKTVQNELQISSRPNKLFVEGIQEVIRMPSSSLSDSSPASYFNLKLERCMQMRSHHDHRFNAALCIISAAKDLQKKQYENSLRKLREALSIFIQDNDEEMTTVDSLELMCWYNIIATYQLMKDSKALIRLTPILFMKWKKSDNHVKSSIPIVLVLVNYLNAVLPFPEYHQEAHVLVDDLDYATLSSIKTRVSTRMNRKKEETINVDFQFPFQMKDSNINTLKQYHLRLLIDSGKFEHAESLLKTWMTKNEAGDGEFDLIWSEIELKLARKDIEFDRKNARCDMVIQKLSLLLQHYTHSCTETSFFSNNKKLKIQHDQQEQQVNHQLNHPGEVHQSLNMSQQQLSTFKMVCFTHRASAYALKGELILSKRDFHSAYILKDVNPMIEVDMNLMLIFVHCGQYTNAKEIYLSLMNDHKIGSTHNQVDSWIRGKIGLIDQTCKNQI